MGKYLEIAKRVPRKEREPALKAEPPTPPKRQQEADYAAEAEKAARLLREQGWCAIESRTLGGEVVIWVRDAKVAVPAKWQNAVRYTLEELKILLQPPVPGPEDLRELHEAKRRFGGTFVEESNPAPRAGDGGAAS